MKNTMKVGRWTEKFVLKLGARYQCPFRSQESGTKGWNMGWTMLRQARAVIGMLLLAHAAAAQFTQQGGKLVGTGALGVAIQGYSVAISADGNTAAIGGVNDNSGVGAAWVFTQSGGVWSQQGDKLVGTGAVGGSEQGYSVAISGDGNTAIVGGPNDDFNLGAAWVYTRSGNVWSQQGSKLVGTGAVGNTYQGWSVAISGDGNTAIVGGLGDSSAIGAAWVYTRSGGVWSQQGSKLVGTGAVGSGQQGFSVAISEDGNTAIVGGPDDNFPAGAAWVYTQSGGVWTQQGSKLVGTGAIGQAVQGSSVAVSGDGNTAIIGAYGDSADTGAAWVWTRSGGIWSQQGSKLVGTGAIGAAEQGTSGAISPDGNTAVVGGWYDNSYAGAAWVYTQSGGVWTQQGSKLVGTGAVGNAYEGRSVAISANGTTVIVGGPEDFPSGAAWVFTSPVSPTAVASGSATICAGSSTPLSGSGGVSCSWAPATGLDNPASCTPNASPSTTTTYTLTVTDSLGNLSTNNPTVTVTVNPLPTATITPSGPINLLYGGNVTLTASSAVSYVWSTGATTASITVGTAGSYTVTVTDGNGCSATSAPLSVTVGAPTPNVWTPLGPDGGVVFGVAVDPLAPSTLWATTPEGAFKSTDGGQHWAAVYTAKAALAIAAHPTTEGSALLLDSQRLVWRTTDGGATWALSSAGLSAKTDFFPGHQIQFKPGDASVVYLVSRDGLYESTDGGSSWAGIGVSAFGGNPAHELFIDPAAPTTLWVRVDGLGIMKSADGGTTWAAVNAGLPANGAGVPLDAFAADPLAPATMYAIDDVDGNLYGSVNGGGSWTKITGTPPPVSPWVSFATPVLLVTPGNSSKLLAGGADPTTHSYHVYTSTDGGATWSNATGGLWTAPPSPLAIPVSAPNTVYASFGEGLYATTDGGASWQPINTGLRAFEVSKVAFDLTTPSTWYFHGGENGIYKTTDGGATFAPINGNLIDPVNSAIAVDPTNPQVLYSAGATSDGDGFNNGYYQYLVRSTDGGTTWQQVPNPAHDGTNLQPWDIAVAATSPTAVYVAAPIDGAFKSSDGGVTFGPVNTGVPTCPEPYSSCSVFPYWDAIASVDSTGTNVLIGGYAGVGDDPYRTDNGGTSWAITSGMPAGSQTRGLAVDPSDNQIVYAGTNYGVYKSTDGGNNWAAANNGLPAGTQFVFGISIDPTVHTTLYAAGNFNRIASVYRSIDGAASWSLLDNNAGLQAQVVWRAYIDPANHQHLIAPARGGPLYEITLTPPPTAVASGSAAICAGSSTPLSGSGGVSCSWAPATGLSDPTSCTPTASPSTTTTYTLVVTDSLGATSANNPTVTVTVNPPPTASVTGGGVIPSGGSTTVSATLTGTQPWTVAWSDGVVQAGVTSSPATRTVSPTTTTTYAVTSISDATGCPGTTSGSAVVTVWAGTLSSLSLSPPTVIGGSAPTTGNKVKVSIGAPPGGATVALTSSNPAVASVPATVTIAAGSTSATFVITTELVAAATDVVISAGYLGTTQVATLIVKADVALSSLSIAPAKPFAPATATGTVTLNKQAPVGGVVVALSSANPAATVPATVTVPATTTSATFTITTFGVNANTTGTVSASYGAVTKQAALTVRPLLSSLSLAASHWPVGLTLAGNTISLNGAAPTGGISVALSSSDPGVTVPASVAIAAGATSAVFSLLATAMPSSNPVTVAVTYAGATRTDTVTITAAAEVSRLTLSPSNPIGGASSTGKVTLTDPAPDGGAAVALVSANSAATVPTSIIVPAGSTSASFTITTESVSAVKTGQITATYPVGSSVSATLTVRP